MQKVKAPDGAVSWTEETFERLRHATPESLVSRMRVNHAVILNVINQRGDSDEVLRRLIEDSHEDERGKTRLLDQAESLKEELLVSGVLERLEPPDQDGRTLELAPALQQDFALNQPLASFAQAAFDLLDTESETFTLDVLSVVEAILDDPFPVLMAQSKMARGEAIQAMKAEGIEYEERMELLEEVSYPKPLEEGLLHALGQYRETHPWVSEDDLSPKAVVRDLYENGQTFSEFIAHYGIARSEGAVLRYLSDTYRALRQTVPDRHKTDELDDIVEWLGEMIRQTDSSLLDEWEALTDPESVQRAAEAVAQRRRARSGASDLRQRPCLPRDDPQRDVPEGPAGFARQLPAPGRPRRRRAPADEGRRVGGRAGRVLGRARAARRGPRRAQPGALRGRHLQRPRVERAPDHQRPRGPPRLGDRRHRGPRRVRRGGRARHPDAVLRMRVALDGGPYAVAASPDGALWVTLVEAGEIARVTLDGDVQRFRAAKKPTQITPQGWFTHAKGIGRITPDGIVTKLKIGAAPYGIVEAPDRAVWFTAENTIGRFNGKLEWFAAPSTPAMIANGPDGAMWFTLNATSSVGRITHDGKMTVRELPTRDSGPVGICGTHDAVWFTELLANQLGRIGVDDIVQELPLADGAKPHAVIPAQADGVWVSLWGAHAVAHISDDGEYAEIPLDPDAEPHGMAVGADGALWVACEAGYLQRIS